RPLGRATQVPRRRCGLGDGDGVVEVQFAETPVIEQPIRDIRILLKLQQRDARTNRMNGAGRNEVKLARGNAVPVDKLFDCAVSCRDAHLFGRKLIGQSQSKRRCWLSIENVPALALAASEAALARLLVVRVDLDRQAFAREDVFCQERQVVYGTRILEPDLANASAVRGPECSRDCIAPPRFFDLMLLELHTS